MYVKKNRDFVPIRVLGQGAYGKVHLVQDKSTKKLYAQKQLRKPVIPIVEEFNGIHSNHVKRTIYERQILSNINHHPNIVKLFHALQDKDKFYLILEYIPGGELFHHLTSNNSLGSAFKEDHVAFYSAQMALALRHLHKLGIVYRDLKPENCLLDSRGNLVLTDFGLSKDIGDGDENCKSVIGTPEYMAPEVLKSVDWWSLGCVIYDMMSGKAPFTGNSHKIIQDKILTKKLILPFYFSLDAKDLLNKLLNKSPEKRFKVDDQWPKFTQHR
ncbi:Pkinase-domain-containing protein, partial [Yamadazyma tenuis ATCC 10573]